MSETVAAATTEVDDNTVVPEDTPTILAQSDNDEGESKDQSPSPSDPVETPEPEGAPESYELDFPEHINIPEEGRALLQEQFKSANLTNDQASTIVKMYADEIKRVQDVHAGQSKAWAEETKSDPEIGGEHFDAMKSNVGVALRKFDPNKELGRVLEDSGLGNHPAVLRFIHKVGAALAEDTVARGAPGESKGPRSLADLLYSKVDIDPTVS